MIRFKKAQRRALARVAEKFDLSLIILFGSQARERAETLSDVDIAILPAKDLTISSYSLLIHSLGRVVGNYSIDLTILKHAGPFLLGQIAKNCRLLYESRKGFFQEFRLHAMKRYVDALPIFRVHELYLRRKVKEYQRELAR